MRLQAKSLGKKFFKTYLFVQQIITLFLRNRMLLKIFINFKSFILNKILLPYSYLNLICCLSQSSVNVSGDYITTVTITIRFF